MGKHVSKGVAALRVAREIAAVRSSPIAVNCGDVRAEAQKPPISVAAPEEFLYLQPGWVIARRKGAWWLSPPFSSHHGERPDWQGPYKSPNAVAMALAQRAIVGVLRRHRQRLTHYAIVETDPRHGLGAARKAKS